MRTAASVVGVALALTVAYFLFWPVPVEPVSWQAPTDRGHVDPFAPNELLTSISGINLGDHESPEDATLGTDNRIYTTTADGTIIRIQNRGVSEFAFVGGRPLGIETDRDGSLIVANSYSGLQRVSPDGQVSTLLDEIDGTPLPNANNLAIGRNGLIYFSQSSTKFTAEHFGGSYEASLLDILEHGGHGNVYVLDSKQNQVRRLMTGLNYANGVAVSADGSFILVAETASYRILKHWLTGEKKGSTEVLIDNLPGFPDNIKNGLNGRFWVGIAAPRNHLIDSLSDQPLLRKMIQRLPSFLRPKAVPFSHVIAINDHGEVLMNLHDADGRYPTLTGVLETRDSLYLTTLFGSKLPRLNKRDLM